MSDYRNSDFESQQKSHRNTDCDEIYNDGMQIGDRIRDARKRMKLTQKQLAKKVGMSQGALSELETGASGGTTLIATFAAALGVNALWLETGRGDRAPSTAHVEVSDTARIMAQSAAEMNLLAAFRLADEIERGIFSAHAESVFQRIESERRYK